MMSVADIRHIQREAAKKAASQNLTPFIVEKEDIEDWKVRPQGFPFPFLGDYVPRGWELVDSYFVDSSGFGAEIGEPALSIKQFVAVLEPGFGYAITEAGQFQVYIGKFKRMLGKAAK